MINKVDECAAIMAEIAKAGKPKPGTAAHQHLTHLEQQFRDCFQTIEGCFCEGRGRLLEEALSAAQTGDIRNAKNIAVAAFKTFNMDAKKAFSKLF